MTELPITPNQLRADSSLLSMKALMAGMTPAEQLIARAHYIKLRALVPKEPNNPTEVAEMMGVMLFVLEFTAGCSAAQGKCG